MHEFIFFNGQILRAADALFPAISSAVLYGRGIFTTVAIRDAEPFLWDKHQRRLSDHAKKIGLDLTDFDETEVKNALFEIIEKNKFTDGRARLTFFDEGAGEIWKFDETKKTGLLITTADFRVLPPKLRLTVSPYSINSRSPLAGVKSCNYLEQTLALDESKSRGFDEAVRLNERGEITSACLANIFWLKDEKLFTPALETGCLQGTTREYLMENADVIETCARLEKLYSADAIFLTSAGLGIVQVDENQNRLREWAG